MIIFLKAAGYGIGFSILMGIVFFALGLFFEVDNRDTETVLKYDKKAMQYKYKTKIVEKDISGDTTAYFTMAGMFLGLILGVILAFDKNKKIQTLAQQTSEPTLKKTPPKIP